MPSIQVKVVGDFCNLRCTYCRDRDFNRESKKKMSLGTLTHLINIIVSIQTKIQRMHWIGGEPLLAGVDFFKEVIRLQGMFPDKKWINTIQTNGVLINKEWAILLKDNFRVGVSIDGSESMHNKNRINSSGNGSYQDAMRGVDILRGNAIYPSVICVITKDNCKFGGEILRDLVNRGFTRIAFNQFYNTATDSNVDDSLAVNNDEWLSFLIDIFKEWLVIDRKDIQIREIDDMLSLVCQKNSNSCMFKGTCSSWMTVDFDGNVYPCERLGRKIYFGNILNHNSFEDLIRTPIQCNFTEMTNERSQKCNNCHLKNLCNNGCVAHRSSFGNNGNLYVYCNSRLSFFEYLFRIVKESSVQKNHQEFSERRLQ